jgi:hypothetical protein
VGPESETNKAIIEAPDPQTEEVARLERLVAELETEIATLESELGRFERQYTRRLGSLLTELEEARADYAEQLAALRPDDQQADRQARTRRASAERMAQEAEATANYAEPDDAQLQSPSVDSVLKDLFREAARAFHPDLGEPEESRSRGDYMAEANRAYQDRDADKLRDLLDSWRLAHPARDTSGALREVVARRIAKLQHAVEMLRSRRSLIEDTDLYSLWQSYLDATGDNRDFFEEQAEVIESEIVNARHQLHDLLNTEAR